MNITLSDKQIETIVTERVTVTIGEHKLQYIDYLNDSGRVIDSVLRDENGNTLTYDDPGYGEYSISEIMDYIQANF